MSREGLKGVMIVKERDVYTALQQERHRAQEMLKDLEEELGARVSDQSGGALAGPDLSQEEIWRRMNYLSAECLALRVSMEAVSWRGTITVRYPDGDEEDLVVSRLGAQGKEGVPGEGRLEVIYDEAIKQVMLFRVDFELGALGTQKLYLGTQEVFDGFATVEYRAG